MRTLRIYSLNNFPIYHTAVVGIVRDGNFILLYWTGLTAQFIKTCLKIAFGIRQEKGKPLKQCNCSSELIFMAEIATFTQVGLMRSDLMLLSR